MDRTRLLIATGYRLLTVSYVEGVGFGPIETVWSRGGAFFGCTWDEHRIYVACRYSHIGGVLSDEGEAILRFDKGLGFIDVWFRSRVLADVHQICCVGDAIWATNTFYNSLLIIDRSTKATRSCAPGARATSPGCGVCGDVNHFNTVRYDGRVVYVVANNMGPSTNGGGRRSSEVVLVDPATGATVQRAQLRGSDAHDVWKEEGGYRSLASRRGVICGSRHETYGRLKPWLRGVAIRERLMFVGWTPVVTDRSQRSKRLTTRVLVYDRASDRAIDELELEGAGEVNDMMILNHLDLARFGQHPILPAS